MIFKAVLVATTLLCSLVAGFLFAFAAVAMPGIGRLEDRAFVRAFQVIDGVIQDNQPVFMFVWVGSAISLIVSAILGAFQLDMLNAGLLIALAVAYLLGVQLPTARINIPLNNAIQAHNLDEMNEEEISKARTEFEQPWNRWNKVRSIVATCVATSLYLLLLWM